MTRTYRKRLGARLKDLREGVSARVPRRGLLSVAGWVLASVALGVAGTVLGLRVAGPAVADTELGSVSVRIRPALQGSVDAYIPLADWGVRARAFSAPVELHVEPRRVDRRALLEAAAGDRQILEQAEEDAKDAAGHVLARALLWSVAGALVLGVGVAL
ncbi:MAG TPA: hypothetical protein VE270_04130, partial [Thermoleophilaceae bacterium]|nr:hypothetical protein [Thermoleophilaceae bacterium]